MTDEFISLGTRAGTAGTGLGAVRRRIAVALSRMSERPGDPPYRGPLARAAERILLAAARRGDRDAIDGIWNAWLRRPDDVRWGLLSELFPAAVLAGAVFAAATDPVRDASGRSAIGAFCLRRDMVPAETGAERALFFVLSGQPELHRAVDPDGSALAAACQAAAEPLRAALREATLNSGNPALIRNVSGRYALADGQLLERYYGVSSLVHLGDAVVSVNGRTHVLTVRHGAGRSTHKLARTAEPSSWALARAGDGFVVAARDRVLYGTVTGTRLADITPPGLRPGKSDLFSYLASEPHAGRVASVIVRPDMDAPNDVVVLGPDIRHLQVVLQ